MAPQLEKMRLACTLSRHRGVCSRRAVPMRPEHAFARMEIECSVLSHVGDDPLQNRF
jgi:hypothetical protein